MVHCIPMCYLAGPEQLEKLQQLVGTLKYVYKH